MIFGEADGEGEVPEAWGYAAAEFADRARGGGSRRLQSHWAAFWGKARSGMGAMGAAAAQARLRGGHARFEARGGRATPARRGIGVHNPIHLGRAAFWGKARSGLGAMGVAAAPARLQGGRALFEAQGGHAT